MTDRNLLTLVPAMKLEDSVFAALAGAAYHLGRVNTYLTDLTSIKDVLLQGTQRPGSQQEEQRLTNLIHWHLRAFLWEMVATFDTLLQWANQRYDLGYEPHQVRWDNIERPKKRNDSDDWRETLRKLKTTNYSSWYTQVCHYRNYAHWSFHFVQMEYSAEWTENKEHNQANRRITRVWLTPALEGQLESDIRQQLPGYYQEMKKVVGEILS